MEQKKDDHLWDRFIKLGEMIGDGLHREEKWISKEYNRLAKILVPEVKEVAQERRHKKAAHVNEQIEKLIQNFRCKKEGCAGELRQSRSGSKIMYCKVCNSRYKATTGPRRKKAA